MGKKNSKLKQDTIDRLTTDTYCKLMLNTYTYKYIIITIIATTTIIII